MKKTLETGMASPVPAEYGKVLLGCSHHAAHGPVPPPSGAPASCCCPCPRGPSPEAVACLLRPPIFDPPPHTLRARAHLFFPHGSAASALTSPTSARARMPASTRLHVHGTSGWRTAFNIYTGAVHGARDCTTNRRRRVIVVNYRNRAESPSNGRKLQISFGDSCYRSLSLPLLLTQIKHGPTVGRFSRHKRNVDPNKDETKKKAINWRRI